MQACFGLLLRTEQVVIVYLAGCTCVHSGCVALSTVSPYKLQEAATDCGRVILVGCVRVEGIHNPVVARAGSVARHVGLFIFQLALVVLSEVPVASAYHYA